MGFNIGEIVESEGYKKLMSKVYGWGAAVVLAGALFKIQHWPFAGIMLTVGMGTEIVIFFLSAFEPLHKENDWSLVYPELAGIEDGDELMDMELARGKGTTTRKSAIEKFDEMLESAEITPELFERMGTGLQSLSSTTENLQNVSDATVATNNYIENFEKASEKVNSFADSYSDSAEKLNKSADGLAASYENSTNMVKESGTALSDAYAQLTNSMNEEFESSSEGNKSYGDQLQVMTKNLTALNAVYELQLKGTNDHLETSKQMYAGLDEMMSNLHSSVEDTKAYRDEVSKLNANLSAMNNVYGNMLSAMNVKVD